MDAGVSNVAVIMQQLHGILLGVLLNESLGEAKVFDTYSSGNVTRMFKTWLIWPFL